MGSRRWWFVVLMLSVAWLLVGTTCKEVREARIVSFEISPDSVVAGGSVFVAWQAEFVGLRDGGPYCTLQRTFEDASPEPLAVVPCIGSRTDGIGADVSAGYVNYRFSALRRSGQSYESEVVQVAIRRDDVDVDVEVLVVPESVTLEPGGVQDFTATVSGASDTSVTWSATCGDISGSGNTITYTAPSAVPSGDTCFVRATSVADEGAVAEAVVTIEPDTSDSMPTLTAGYEHSLALLDDGSVWAWGANGRGQLGDGSTTNRPYPVQLNHFADVTKIAAGMAHSVALGADGTVWAWGRNVSGQLGDGSTTDRLTPVQVSGLADVTAIAAGYEHSVALRADGTVWAWGGNWTGQLGDGSTIGSLMPVQISVLGDVASITAGYDHSLALGADGTVWAWGGNGLGQLGDGTSTNRPVPVQVSGLGDVASIAAGGNHSLALHVDGTAWAWGWNWAGQLGTGGTTPHLMPVRVNGFF